MSNGPSEPARVASQTVGAPGERLRAIVHRFGPAGSAWLAGAVFAAAAGGASAATAWVLGLDPRWPALVGAIASGLAAAGLTLAFTRLVAPPAADTAAAPSALDGLTGVPRRDGFVAHAQREWERARRYAVPCAMLVADLDHLSALNARHGATTGDELLRRLADVIGHALRQSDSLGRLEGARLAVFLPHTDLLGAVDVAERIRQQVLQLPAPGGDAGVPATVSVGVAPMRAELPTLEWMLQEAETALQCAKVEGRNCVRALQFVPSKEGGIFRVNPH